MDIEANRGDANEDNEVGKLINKNLLCIIIDLNHNAWNASDDRENMQVDGESSNSSGNSIEKLYEILNKLFMFINSYLLQSATNDIAIYGSYCHEAKYIAPLEEDLGYIKKLSYAVFSSKIICRIIDYFNSEDFLSKEMNYESSNTSKIGSALKKSNCYINSWKLKNSRPDTSCNARVLIFQASNDNNDDYNSIVNSMFACQKHTVVVDSIMFNNQDSILLQQCSYLTGGIYTRTKDSNEFIHCLFTDNYLIDSKTRKKFNFLFQEELDLRVSCS